MSDERILTFKGSGISVELSDDIPGDCDGRIASLIGRLLRVLDGGSIEIEDIGTVIAGLIDETSDETMWNDERVNAAWRGVKNAADAYFDALEAMRNSRAQDARDS